MKRGLYISGAIAFCLGVSLLVVAFLMKEMYLPFFLYLGIGLLAILFAYTYTAGDNPYGYKGLGDLSVFLFFGVISVVSMPLLLTGELTLQSFYSMLIVGSLSTAVLHLNNLRDHENDERAGKKTLVVRVGFARAKMMHFAWLVIAFVGALLSLLLNASKIAWYVAPFVALVIHAKRVYLCEIPKDLDKELKIVALTTFFIALLLFVSLAF
jgi:1,4-dihydroxy-2-naphthoate octaprenyltransferase